MAEDKKTTEIDKAAETKDQQGAAEQVKESGKTAGKSKNVSSPYPSQEEADRIKSAAASGAAPYKTRDMKA